MAFETVKHPGAFTLDHSSKATRRIEEPAHLAFVRRLPSVVSGAYGCEAAHLRMSDAVHRKPSTAKGRKPDDWWVLPLLPEEHRAQHDMNERAWWTSQGIDDPCGLAKEIHRLTGQHEEAVRLILSRLPSPLKGRGFAPTRSA